MYNRSPTVTTPETTLYPMRRINYPAIAICNVNRISHRAAIDFAQELYLRISACTLMIAQ